MALDFPLMLYRGDDPADQKNQTTVHNPAQCRNALEHGYRAHPLYDEAGAKADAALRAELDAEEKRLEDKRKRVEEISAGAATKAETEPAKATKSKKVKPAPEADEVKE